jgi:hypothetical protein
MWKRSLTDNLQRNPTDSLSKMGTLSYCMLQTKLINAIDIKTVFKVQENAA